MNTSIANNPVFQNLQVGEKHESTTGTIIYANKYSGVSPIAMPKAIKDILDSNVGTIGTILSVVPCSKWRPINYRKPENNF